MFKGIAFALSACFIWGLIFVVPQYMHGFSFIEIVLGRYFFYGIISACILLKAKIKGSFSYPLSIWVKALYYSLIATIGYYTCVVLALRYTSPAICTLILGISPISIALYGNLRQKECSFKTLIFPSCLIIIGLVIINAPHFKAAATPLVYLEGLLLSFVALGAWTWYAVANAKFLKREEVASSDWTTLMGFMTFLAVGILGVFLIPFYGQESLQKYFTINSSLLTFLAGSAVLGLLCSWVGTFLWNKASFYLPISLAGQLLIFETVFSLIFICLLEKRIPPKMECLGIILLLVAIGYGIRKFSLSLKHQSH